MDNTIHWFAPQPFLDTSPVQQVEVTVHSTRTTGAHPYITTPLHETLQALKNKIDSPSGQWDDAKKITNPYEHIFLSLHSRIHLSMSARHPLSRSYFKMIEMWNQIERDTGILLSSTVRASSHSAEGPGGFLEAIQDKVKEPGRHGGIPMITMTLNSTEKNIPGFRKSQAFLRRYPSIHVTYGSDGTGNLYHLVNQDAFASEASIRTPNVSLYTADGGFDFSADFNGQEYTIQRLLVAEFIAGLTTLSPGPTSIMIIKIFDTTHRATLDLLYTMTTCFDRTGLIKPLSSRPANSERYWIGVGYRGAPVWILELFRRLIGMDAPSGWDRLYAREPWTEDALELEPWAVQLQRFQEEVEQHQLNTIQVTLNLIQMGTLKSTDASPELFSLLLTNITKSRSWCSDNGIPVNSRYMDLTDIQIAHINFKEIREEREAAPVSCSRTCLHTLFRRGRMPGGWSSDVSQPLPTVRAWRSQLPASVLGRSPFQTVSEIHLPRLECASVPSQDPTESLPVSDLRLVRHESLESWPALVSTGHHDG